MQNDRSGVKMISEKIVSALTKLGLKDVVIGMEATSIYGDNLVYALREDGNLGRFHRKIQVKTQVTTQVTITDKILVFCLEPHSKAEIAEHCGYKNTKNFTQKYLRPLLDTGKLQMTMPDKPRSQNQKYITSER